MSQSNAIATLMLAGLLITACPAGGKNRPATPSDYDFACKERRAEYSVTGGWLARKKDGGLSEPEAGVVVACEGDRLRIEKWRLLSHDGDRKSSSHSLTPEEFDAFWEKIEASGWRNLEDCENPAAGENDPIYTFDISDQEASLTTACPGKELPFPFDRLLNEFDLTAASYDE